MADRAKVHKKSKNLITIVFVIIALLLPGYLITYNLKQTDKNAQINELRESIKKAESVPNILQKSVEAYDKFNTDTSDQTAFGYFPGLGASNELDQIAYGSPDEQKQRCNWDVGSHLGNIVNEQQESVGKLSGSDQELLENWNKEADIVANWVMCYKGVLAYNKLQARNGTDDFKSISLKIKGRITVLKEANEENKVNLRELESKSPLFV